MELAHFALRYFGPRIAHKIDDRANVIIRVAENGQIYGELSLKQDAISVVTKAVRELYREYNV